MNFSMIRYVIGLVMLFESAFLSLPCLIALIYHEKKGFSFWIMLFVCLIIGILFVMKKEDSLLRKRRFFNSCDQLDRDEFFWSTAICDQWRYSIGCRCDV